MVVNKKMYEVLFLIMIFLIVTCWWQLLGNTIKCLFFELIFPDGVREWLMNFFLFVTSLAMLGIFYFAVIFSMLIVRYLLLKL